MSYNFAPVINDPRNQHQSQKGQEDAHVPTDDVEVRVELRKLGHPVTLSGEGNQERRARLSALLHEQIAAKSGTETTHDASEELEESDEEFYTPGKEELTDVRTRLLRDSVLKASERIARQKAHANSHNFTKVLKHRRNIAAKLSLYELNGSYTMNGNQRMLSRVRHNSTEQKVACSSWEGNFYILQKDATGFYQEIRRSAPGYHTEMATIAWCPTEENLLVSGGAEGKVNLWNVAHTEGDKQTNKLSPSASVANAHGKRIAQVGFHPSGDFYATTSYDMTWRLWDVRQPNMELLEQEGHSKEVYSMAFHPDGGLLATGGLDAIGLLWDLRSGRSVCSFEGHVKGIYSMDFSPNGYHLATGSGDNSVKIWDLRKGRGAELFSIPAHTKIVTDVRFLQGSTNSRLASEVTDENDSNPERLSVAGTCLVTCSYDNTVKVWSADNWTKISTLTGHTDKVSSCEVSSNGEQILSCGWDRTMRTWGTEV